MRVIARGNLSGFRCRHSETQPSLERWLQVVRFARWASMADVQAAFPKAKVLNGEHVRFEIHGGNYRLIATFDFRLQIVFIKFIGTHAEYDRIDALTVSLF